MTKSFPLFVVSFACAITGNVALADDIEGRIESIDTERQTILVQGITFHVTGKTDFDDGLRNFADLAVGQKVEVDFKYREGKHFATEIELDD